MRKFDYSFLNNGLLPASLVNLTANISALKTMAGVRKEEYARIFTELEAVAKVQSIKSSNAIEGIVTSDERMTPENMCPSRSRSTTIKPITMRRSVSPPKAGTRTKTAILSLHPTKRSEACGQVYSL